MANNYKILRKGKLADDLFGDVRDEAAWDREEAERLWALNLDKDPGAQSIDDPIDDMEGNPKLVEPAEVIEMTGLLEAEPPVEQGEAETDAPAPRPAPAPMRIRTADPWVWALVELVGNPALEGLRTLGVCAVEKARGAGPAAAFLARWAAQRAAGPILVVEAQLGKPELARALQAENVGLKDALLRGEGVQSLIQATLDDKILALPSGGPFTRGERRRAVAELPAMLKSAREGFATTILELPAMDDPDFSALPVASLVDAVILVADSRTVRPKQLESASDMLLELGPPLAATLLRSTQRVSRREPERSAAT